MVTLGIQTASSNEALVFLDGKKNVGEITWKGQADETEKLLPTLVSLLKKTKRKSQDIKKIIVVTGPGPFSALRIGVSVANTLAYVLRAELFSVDTESLWRMRAPSKSAILLLHAGGKFVVRSAVALKTMHGEMNEVLAAEKNVAKKIFYGDITADEKKQFDEYKKPGWKFIDEKKLVSVGQALLKLPKTMLKKEKGAALPQYWRPPNITTSRP